MAPAHVRGRTWVERARVTSRKIRVLHVVNNLHYGGMERVVAEITRRTDSSRFDTHLLALRFIGHFGNGLEEFATLHVADPMEPWSMLRPQRLARQFARIAPDVVHMHSGVWYKASSAASIAAVPFTIFTDHGRETQEPWLNQLVDRRAARKTDVVVCVSEELRGRVATIVKDPSRLRVIHNGVDTEHYSPHTDDGDFRRELGIGLDVPLIGSVGRLQPVKGYAVLVEAFARLVKMDAALPKPQLVLVGDGSERSALEARAVELGVSESVHFMGWRSDIERITRALTLFSMSSHSEGTSVSLLEAMSAGTCPVVTDVGGNSAVLGTDLKHRLVRPDDPEALAAALLSALCDRHALERDAVVARARVLQDFSLESMVHQYEALYDESAVVNAASR
jgi:glycosyltransferase involved in cell wall biosynthesis